MDERARRAREKVTQAPHAAVLEICVKQKPLRSII
jgi:hypothetical protein